MAMAHKARAEMVPQSPVAGVIVPRRDRRTGVAAAAGVVSASMAIVGLSLESLALVVAAAGLMGVAAVVAHDGDGRTA